MSALVSFREQLLKKAEAGEPLVRLNKIKILESFAPSTLHRGIRSGQIPAIRIMGAWVSSPEVVLEAIKANQLPENPKKPRASRKARAAEIQSACALARKISKREKKTN